ncbi:MAG: glycosyltransferase family 39 protein [Chloroflexota bacterium]|nr:glycosyltransferase family 39 protein [Chloroflexota bacterium]
MRLKASLLVVLVVGLAVRTPLILQSDFPLHDGGLFHMMAHEIRDAGFGLPMTTAYNNAAIPFAYPPLGIYALALGSQVIDPLQLLRFLPLLYSVLAIVGVYVLTAVALSRRHALVASLVFALTPQAFYWLIVGGGVTRGLGLVLALFTIAAAIRGCRDGGRLLIGAAGVLGGLTIVTHPEAAAFAAASTAVLCLVNREWRSRSIPLLAMAAIGLTISAAWWATIVHRHGLDVLTGASGSRQALVDSLQRVLELRLTGGPFPALDIPLFLGMIGIAVAAWRRRWLIPAWTLAVLVTPAAGAFYITVPWAALGSLAVLEVVDRTTAGIASGRRLRLGGAVLFALALVNVLLIPLDRSSPLVGIPRSDRSAMAAMETSGPPVAVLTNRPWWLEGPGEWFPALTGRSNAALAQGSEWLGSDTWNAQRLRHEGLQQCGRSVGCIAEWMTNADVDTLFVSAVADLDVEEIESDGRFAVQSRFGETAVLHLTEPSD